MFTPLLDITDKGIQAMVSNLLTHSIELHHLSLAGCCSLTARSFHAISQLPLLSLDLSYCFQLQDDDLLALIKEESHLFALQELHIRGCRHLTPRSLIPLFDRLTQLRTLVYSLCGKSMKKLFPTWVRIWSL